MCPIALKAMSQTSPIFGIPWIIFISFGVALLTYWFSMHTRVGRQIFALGSNPLAAPLRGIDVTRVTLAGFQHIRRIVRLGGHSVCQPLGFR